MISINNPVKQYSNRKVQKMLLDTIEQENVVKEEDGIRFKSVRSIFGPSSYQLNVTTLKSSMPLKFKGYILASFASKHPSHLKIAFFRWFSRISNKKHESAIEGFLTGKGRKLSTGSFLYRLKCFAKQEIDRQTLFSEHKRSPLLSISDGQNIQFEVPSGFTSSISSLAITKKKKGHNKTFSLAGVRATKISCPLESNDSEKRQLTQQCDRKSLRSNTIASLKSIIDEKVFKKKSQKKISNQLDRENELFATFGGLKSGRDNMMFDPDHQETSLPEQIRRSIEILRKKKSLKIIDTIRVLKQVSAAYLQACLTNSFKKVKFRGFTQIKFSAAIQAEKCSNDLLIIEREYELTTENIHQQQQIQELTYELQTRVTEIEEIQQEMGMATDRIQKVFISLLCNRVVRVFNYRIRPAFYKVMQTGVGDSQSSTGNILPNQSAESVMLEDAGIEMLEDSGVYGMIQGSVMSIDCDGLNSVKRIMEESEVYENTYERDHNDSFPDLDD